MEGVAKQANLFLKRLGVSTRVAVAKTHLNPQQFMAELAPNEGVAFMVNESLHKRGKFVSVDKIATYSKDFAKVLHIKDGDGDSWANTKNIPERSSNSVMNTPNKKNKYNVGKNCIALKYKPIKGLLMDYGLNPKDPASVNKAIAFNIVHGSGHNAQAFIKSKLPYQSEQSWDHFGGVVTEGNEMKDMIRSKQLKFDDFLNPNIHASPNVDPYTGKDKVRDEFSQKIDKNPGATKSLNIEDVLRFEIAHSLGITGNPSNKSDKQFVDEYLEKIITYYPYVFPNLTYKLIMEKRFGKHKAVANSKLGYIPK